MTFCGVSFVEATGRCAAMQTTFGGVVLVETSEGCAAFLAAVDFLWYTAKAYKCKSRLMCGSEILQSV